MTTAALSLALLAAWLVQAFFPRVALRSAQPEQPRPEPAPPADPRRDPGWCHAHNKHRDEEEH